MNSITVTTILALLSAAVAKPCPPSFPIALDNCGPASFSDVSLGLPSLLKSPLCGCKNLLDIPLPCNPLVGAPRTIANTCSCTKTVLRPQLVQQLINVPTIRKYIQTLAAPVVENIHYTARPVNCPALEPTIPPLGLGLGLGSLGLGCKSPLSFPFCGL